MKLETISMQDIKPPIAPLEKSLQTSLIEEGQVDPIKLRKIDDPLWKYEIVYGRRRYVAANQSNLKTIEALIVEDMDDTRLHKEALIENSGKPNPMDEALHMAALREEGYTGKQIAKLSGYSPGRVSQTLKLVDNLHADIQPLVKQGQIKISAAYALARLPRDEQLKIISANDKVSSKVADEALRDYQSQQLNLPLWEEDDLPEGLYITASQMKKLMDGETIEVEWAGDVISFAISQLIIEN